MSNATSNIESVARDICSRRFANAGLRDAEIEDAVDRYWHCVAAELESGRIDETGAQLIPFDFDHGLAAYRDWCSRHPQGNIH